MSGSAIQAPSLAASPRRRGFSGRVERGSLWILGFGGGFAFFEPSPYEFAFALALVVFLVGGMRLHVSALFFLGLLAAFNLGGLFSVVPHIADSVATTFVAVSIYLAVTSFFFAMLVQERPVERMNALKGGLVTGAAAASLAGILGYFDVAGLAQPFTLHGRASGTFKDPNVLGTFVILPAVLLAQDLLLRRGSPTRNIALLGLILFGGVFLSFSRGAWGHALGSLGLMTAMTFLLTADIRTRTRIVLLSLSGFLAALAALGAALSVEEVRTMFELRASLSQDYDVGATGRFGNQLRSIPDLLERPNGYGPLQFRAYWPEDPHNVYVNAFASYGWLGGIAYLMLALATLAVGWTVVAARAPTQNHAIAVWAVLFVQIFQGLQIDTDHWRHFYMLLGLTWGFFGYARTLEASRRI